MASTSLLRQLPLLRLQAAQCQLINVRFAWGNDFYTQWRNKAKIKNSLPQWRNARNEKVLKIKLPDTDFQRRLEANDVSPAERREHLREQGMLMPRQYEEKPMYIASTGAVIEQFVAAEGDGKSTLISKDGALDAAKGVQKKGKSVLAVRRIRKYDTDFDPRDFAMHAQEIYIKVHEALVKRDEDAILQYATEKLYPEIVHNLRRQTLHWRFIRSLEEPRVMQVRTADILNKANLFAQITVRFHSQQVLAVYDRFGRLIHGGPTVSKDVLEYVVFEKHLANVYGTWRMHAKIIPDWLPPLDPSYLTFTIPKKVDVVDDEEQDSKATPFSEQEDEEEDKGEIVYDRFGRAIKK